MKITNFIVLAAVLILGLLAFTAFAGNRDTGLDLAVFASTSPVSVLQSNQQPVSFERFTAITQTAAVLNVSQDWVAPCVGMMVLDICRPVTRSIKQLNGYSDILIKPKLATISAKGTITNYTAQGTRFNGLGGNHFARADV